MTTAQLTAEWIDSLPEDLDETKAQGDIWCVSWASVGWRGQVHEHFVPCDSHEDALAYARVIMGQDGNTGVRVARESVD